MKQILLFSTPSGPDAFIYGIVLALLTFGMVLLFHKIFGGDAGQSKRSDWFPLWYIVPIMIVEIIYLIIATR